MKYPFEQLFLVCTGARCNDAAREDDRGERIREELKDLNKKLGRKQAVRICAVSCLDLCDYGPNMVVQPGGTVYSHMTRKSSKAAYHGVMKDGAARPDLELTEEEFRRS
jgi:(2Fe-2S) ferredoxin